MATEQKNIDVIGDGLFAELCELFDERAAKLHKTGGEFTHQLALVAADFTRRRLTRSTTSDYRRVGDLILKIVRYGLEEDHNKFVNYSAFLADKLDASDPELASAIRSYLKGDYGAIVFPAALLTTEQGARCTCGHHCPSREEWMNGAQCVHAPDCELMLPAPVDAVVDEKETK